MASDPTRRHALNPTQLALALVMALVIVMLLAIGTGVVSQDSGGPVSSGPPPRTTATSEPTSTFAPTPSGSPVGRWAGAAGTILLTRDGGYVLESVQGGRDTGHWSLIAEGSIAFTSRAGEPTSPRSGQIRLGGTVLLVLSADGREREFRREPR